MYNLDYITTQTRREILDSLKYDINKYDSTDLDILHQLYNNDKEVVLLIAENSNTSFETLMCIASFDDEDYFTSLLNNCNIYKYKCILEYINNTSNLIINLHISSRMIKKLEEYI